MESVKLNCIKDHNDLLVAQNVLKMRASDLDRNIHSSVRHFSNIGSSFACALCEKENGYNFTSKKPQGVKISVDITMCDKIFGGSIAEEAFNFFNDLFYINLFVESLSCLGFSPITLDPIIDDNKLGDILHQANICKQQGDWSRDERCLAVCSSLPFINQNLFYKMMVPISISKKLAEKVFTKERSEPNQRIEEILIKQIENERKTLDSTKSNLEFKYFIETLDPESPRIEDLAWDVKNKAGWNLINSPMKELISSHNIFSFFLILSNLALLRFW
jgi:hypothetical protein